jgi:hypothetical protein
LSAEVEDPSASIGRSGVVNHLTVVDKRHAAVVEDATAPYGTRRAGHIGQSVVVYFGIVERERALDVEDSATAGGAVATGDL